MIQELLTGGVGVAISPISIATVILLLSTGARRNGVSYLVGCVAGLAATLTITDLVAGPLGVSTVGSMSSTGAGVLNALLGLCLLLLALRRVRLRDQQPREPKWMSRVAEFRLPQIALLGVLIAAINPKDLGIAINLGLSISADGATAPAQAGFIVLFLVIATSTVSAVVATTFLATHRAEGILSGLHTLLAEHGAVVNVTVLTIYGVIFLGKGIDQLL